MREREKNGEREEREGGYLICVCCLGLVDGKVGGMISQPAVLKAGEMKDETGLSLLTRQNLQPVMHRDAQGPSSSHPSSS